MHFRKLGDLNIFVNMTSRNEQVADAEWYIRTMKEEYHVKSTPYV